MVDPFALAPGDSTLVSADEAKEMSQDSRYTANLHKHQLYHALMLGGTAVLDPPTGTLDPVFGTPLDDGSYLRKLPGETSDNFKRRKGSAAHDPVAASVIWTYVDFLFRQAIDRAAITELLGDVMSDVDGVGTSAEDWLPHAYSQGLAHGWVIGLVTMPNSEQEYASQEHLEAQGLRPYLQLITPLRVWQLDLDDFGRITMALIHEGPKRFREWLPTHSQLYDEDGHKVGGPDPHPFGRVPMEVFVANPSSQDVVDGPLGESAMAASAYFDLQMLQQMSLLDDIQLKTGFPLLVGKPDPDRQIDVKQDVVGGPGHITEYPGDLSYLVPDASCCQELRAYIDWLESLVHKIGGVHRRSQDSVEAHSGLALDYESSPIYATVQRWARRLRVWELRLWRLMGKAIGKSPEEIWSVDVIYPEDFTTRPIDQDVGQSQATVTVFGGYAQAPEFVQAGIKAKLRRALMRDVGHIPEVRDALDQALSAPKEIAAKDGQDPLTRDMAAMEQLTKNKAPQQMCRALATRIAEHLGISSPEVIDAISINDFRWYTEEQAMLSQGVQPNHGEVSTDGVDTPARDAAESL